MLTAYLLVLGWTICNPAEWQYAWNWGVATSNQAPVEVQKETPPQVPVQQFTTREVVKRRPVWKTKYCNGRVCGRYFAGYEDYTVTEQVPIQTPATTSTTTSSSADKYASPQDVIDKALSILKPKPNEVFLDVGSGDGRAVIAAARTYGCRAIGIELDHDRVVAAQENARQAGVEHLVTFIEGDFMQMEWPKADVGYVYLFEQDLKAIRSKLLSLDRFVSFAHKVPGLEMYVHLNGEMYSWNYNNVFAWWDGRAYTSRPCNRSNCSMCNSIQASLNEQKSYRN